MCRSGRGNDVARARLDLNILRKGMVRVDAGNLSQPAGFI
jgi:hypothetical protein